VSGTTTCSMSEATTRISALLGNYQNAQSALLQEMRRRYPSGCRVRFWRSSSQKKPSTGTVVGHSMGHGPELRVRHQSGHVVGVHLGHTRFAVLTEGGAE
jgi:hypothetical protein